MVISARYAIYLTLLVAVLTGAAIFGFGEGNYRKEAYNGMPTPSQAETTIGPIKLTMDLDKIIYRVGDPINITLTLTNISNKTVWLSRSSPPVLDFVVYDIVYNKSLPPSFPPVLQPIYAHVWGGGILVSVSYPIEPNESLTVTFKWTQLEKYGNGPQAIYKQVDHEFYLIAGRIAPGASIYDGIGEISEVETPKILIDIIPEEGIVVEATKFPLKLTMVLDKTKFELSEPVKMAFFIENIGNETLDMSMYEDDFDFVVYDEAGYEVYELNKNVVHPAVYIPMPLPSGLSRPGTLTWSQDYNLKLVTLDPHPQFEYRKVSPGRYQIIGQFVSSHLRFTIKTPPVAITIGLYETESTETIRR
jgi:hypothetical protein